MTSGKAKGEEVYKFSSATREAKWLLNKEVVDYLKKLYDKAIALQTLQDELKGGLTVVERLENVGKQAEIKRWFFAQYEVLDEKFSSFLKLRH